MSDDDQSRIELYLKIQNTVANAINLAEVTVLRELVIELLKDNQRLSDQAADLRINQRIYDRVNRQFADIADGDPKIATIFATLLEQWKIAHEIK